MTKIVGQENLVNELTRVLKIFKNSQCEIRPHFILTGPSGSGKSYTIKSLCEMVDINFIELNAAQLTKEGTSGNSLSKALSPLSNSGGRPTVCFVDEFDKLFISSNSNDSAAHETTTGVQNEFLKVLESDHASVYGDFGKYINIPISNVLFVFAGAFNGESGINLDRLQQIGLKTEFLGRVGLVFNTQKLSLEDLYTILDNSSLLVTYLELFSEADKNEAVLSLRKALADSYENNTLGARQISTFIHQYFIMGGVVTSEDIKKTSFNKKMTL